MATSLDVFTVTRLQPASRFKKSGYNSLILIESKIAIP